MAFEQQTDETKDGIEDIEIVLFSPGPSNVDGIQSGKVSYQILMSDGSIDGSNQVPNLLDRLEDDAAGLVHLVNLASLRDYIRDRLNAEALPTP